MTDKAYSHEQVQAMREKATSARDRLDTLSQPNSRHGELEAYPFGGFSLFPCGKVPADVEGMRINESNKLLLDDLLVILDQFVECEQPSDPDPVDDRECEELFTLIEGLNVHVDYDRIKADSKECCEETKALIVDIDNDLVQVGDKIDTSFVNISGQINGIDTRINTVISHLNTVNANVTTALDGISQLLLCPCEDNIINEIALQLETFKVDIGNQLNNLSTDIDNINVEGANVNIDYQPIYNEIRLESDRLWSLIVASDNSIKESIVEGNVDIQNLISDRHILLSNQLKQCCDSLLEKFEDIDFDINPILDAIQRSESIITESINNYLNHELPQSQLAVQDVNGNPLSFSFGGIGIIGIIEAISTIISLIQLILDFLDREEDPCNNIAVIYSDYYPHKVLVSQLHITFIPANEPKLSKGVPTKTMHVFNPRDDIDWCRDIHSIRPQQGRTGFLRVAWDQDNGKGTVRSWTGGHFLDKVNAIDTATKLMALSTLNDVDYRWTDEGTKKDVKVISWKPIFAVLAYVNDGEVTNLRCFSPPKDGC